MPVNAGVIDTCVAARCGDASLENVTTRMSGAFVAVVGVAVAGAQGAIMPVQCLVIVPEGLRS